MLAAVPVGAFFGVDHLLSPPSPGTTSLASNPPSGVGVGRFANAISSTKPSAVSPAAIVAAPQAPQDVTPVRLSSPSAPAGGKNGLVASIQHELGRVGCYAGATDGVWSDKTRAAMEAFNASVRVNLSTAQPDYILLTLLQGHSARACARSCESTLAGGTCVEPVIEARVVEPRLVPSSSVDVAVPTPGSARKPWTTTVVTPVTLPTRQAAVAERPTAEPPAPVVAETTESSTPVPQPDAVSALPGRMAVGAPPATDVLKPAPARIVTPARAEPPRERPRPVNRPQRMFTDLSRNAP
jgi:hypothetical protein